MHRSAVHPLLPLLAFAACLVVPGAASAQWFPSRSFTTRDGVAQSQISSLGRDAYGFLWVTTQGGVSRFNGQRFLTLTTANGLPDDVVTAMGADDTGQVWFGSDSGPLARWNGDSLHVVDQLPDDFVAPTTALYCLPQGRLLIGTVGGLWLYDGDRFERLLETPVASILTGWDDRVWVLTGDHARATATYRTQVRPARILELVNGKLEPAPVELGVTGINAAASAPGALWLADDSGAVLHLTPVRTTRHDGPPGEEVQALQPTEDGGAWIGTNTGLWRLSADGELTTQVFDPMMKGIPVSSFHIDHERNLWIGTWTQGLYRRTRSAFTLFTTESGLPVPTVWTMVEDEHGCVWMGTDNGGVAIWCADGWREPITTADGLPSNRVLALLAGDDDSIWIGTDQGLARHRNGGTLHTWREGEGLPHSFVRALARDSKGAIWVGTSDGLARWDGTEWQSWTEVPALVRDPIRGLVVDHDDTLWMATDSNGVLRFDGHVFTAFTRHDGLPNDRVWTITVDSMNQIWAGTDSGIWVHRADGTFDMTLGAESGLPRVNVLFLVEDDDHFMWAGTTEGIARIEMSTCTVVRTFSTPDGFSDSEANENAAMRDRDGSLWFGMSRGVTRLDPGNLPRNDVPPPIVLERILANGAPAEAGLPVTDRTAPGLPVVELGPGVTELRLEYSALSYASPADVRFRVMLHGYDPNLCEPTDEDRVTYRNVPPGSYQFIITACNSDGKWTDPPLEVELYLRPLWYQTWWFRFGVVLSFALIVVGWVRVRLAAERRLQRRLEDEVAVRTVELQQANRRISEQNRLLAELSRTDPLTGLANRRVLAEQLPTEMAVLRRELARSNPDDLALHHGSMLAMIDLDHFKTVNDRWGHDTGDQVLQAVSTALAGALREVDLAVRWGGEEFVILARGVNRTGAVTLVQRLLESIAQTQVRSPDGEPISLEASLGFFSFPLGRTGFASSADWQRLVDLADRLMYLAKQRGRARACGLAWKPGADASAAETDTILACTEAPEHPPDGLELLELLL